MPASRGSQTINIGQGSTIESLNVATLARPGELGQAYYGTSNKAYQLVQCDSGATAATPVGVVAAGQLAFWMAKGSGSNPYRVTNDIRVAIGAEDATNDNKRNEVAGVFTTAVTAGYYCAIQQRGNYSAVVSDGGADFTIGDLCVAGNNSTAAIDRVAAGTAPGWTLVGEIAGTESSSHTSVDLNLPVVP